MPINKNRKDLFASSGVGVGRLLTWLDDGVRRARVHACQCKPGVDKAHTITTTCIANPLQTPRPASTHNEQRTKQTKERERERERERRGGSQGSVHPPLRAKEQRTTLTHTYIAQSRQPFFRDQPRLLTGPRQGRTESCRTSHPARNANYTSFQQ